MTVLTSKLFSGSSHTAATALPLHHGIRVRDLIGRSHLYCRYYDLPEGFELVPLGRMTLESNGTISGYDQPGKLFWIPWQQGFAIVVHNRYGSPISTWRQTLDDMPMGYYCDEPETPHKLCLLPDTGGDLGLAIIYLVATCKRYFARTDSPLWGLLAQMLAQGIRARQIKVVINGCDIGEDRIEAREGIEFAYTIHDAWEWSALYEAPLRWNFDYGMLIHDTSRLGPGFREKVENFNAHVRWDHLPATALARCLLGLYSHEFLLRLNPWLKSIDKISKSDGIVAEASGELLLRAHTALALGEQACWGELVDEFNTGSPRIRRHFPSIDLHKFIHAGGSPQGL